MCTAGAPPSTKPNKMAALPFNNLQGTNTKLLKCTKTYDMVYYRVYVAFPYIHLTLCEWPRNERYLCENRMLECSLANCV